MDYLHSAPSLVTPDLTLPSPFLSIPFSAKDSLKTGGRNNVAEGWIYGNERGIHGFDNHKAIDFELPYGAEILAPADGWAARTYQSWLTSIVYTDPKTGHTGRIGFGLGLWLILLHKLPDQEVYWWTKMGHLSWIDPAVHYLLPVQDNDGDWHEPGSLYVPDLDLTKVFTPVKRGDVLAKVGDSGVEWGYRDTFDPQHGLVIPRDRIALPSWDKDIHVHFEVYQRLNGLSKLGEGFDATRICVDPFGQYGQVRPWQQLSPYANYALAPGHLFLVDESNYPLYAK